MATTVTVHIYQWTYPIKSLSKNPIQIATPVTMATTTVVDVPGVVVTLALSSRPKLK